MGHRSKEAKDNGSPSAVFREGFSNQAEIQIEGKWPPKRAFSPSNSGISYFSLVTHSVGARLAYVCRILGLVFVFIAFGKLSES